MDDGGSFWSTLPGLLTAIAGVLTAGATLVGALYSAGLVGKRHKAGPTGPGSPAPGTATTPGTTDTPAAGPPPAPPATPAAPPLRTTPGLLAGPDLRALLIGRGYYDKR